jgi:ankyrin repeat protein
MGAVASLLAMSCGAWGATDLEAALLEAAQQANPAEVRALLDAGADANARAADGSTAMLYAAHFGDRVSVEALLAANGDPNLTNRYGVGPMHEAAQRADSELLRMLIDAGASVDLAKPKGETPLMLASRTSGVDAVRLLIERGADVNVVEQWQGQTPLMYAAALDRGDVAALLIEAGADVDARTRVNELPERLPAVRYFVEIPVAGFTPVMFAARAGAVAALQSLIDGGADLDATTPEGFSSIVIALDNLHFDAAKLLVEAGASPNGGGLFAVVEARNRVNYVGDIQVPTGAESSLDLLELMLANGADPMDRLPQPFLDRDVRFLPPPPPITDVALIRAARSSDVDAMRVLIEGGADPSMQDEQRNGISPMLAVMAGPELPQLIEAEPRPTEEEAMAAIGFLMDQGVDPATADNSGATALHKAAQRDFPELIRQMAAKGADINVGDREGLTPLDYALGNLPRRMRGRGGTPPANATSGNATAADTVPESAAAAVLRELGGRQKEEQTTAAR